MHLNIKLRWRITFRNMGMILRPTIVFLHESLGCVELYRLPKIGRKKLRLQCDRI
jgi:hypothetical protein